MRSVCKIDQYINKNMGKFIIVILLLILAASILVPLFMGIWFLIKNAYRYKYVAPKQRKMFNQLVKGDYVWRVDEDGITYFTVDKIKYVFDYNNDIRKIEIHYSAYNYIDLKPEAAKTFKLGNWHTIKAAAELEYKKIKAKKDEAILGVTSCTIEDIKKASEKLIKQLESTN